MKWERGDNHNLWSSQTVCLINLTGRFLVFKILITFLEESGYVGVHSNPSHRNSLIRAPQLGRVLCFLFYQVVSFVKESWLIRPVYQQSEHVRVFTLMSVTDNTIWQYIYTDQPLRIPNTYSPLDLCSGGEANLIFITSLVTFINIFFCGTCKQLMRLHVHHFYFSAQNICHQHQTWYTITKQKGVLITINETLVQKSKQEYRFCYTNVT